MSKSYAQMTVPERWQWHAQVYAFRRVVLDVPADMRTSPCDEEGKWFDAALVADAERRLRAKRAPQRRAQDEEMQREGRAVANAWARQRGFLDVEEYRMAERLTYTEALERISASILAGARMPGDLDAADAAE